MFMRMTQTLNFKSIDNVYLFRYNPDKGNSHKWENAMTLDKASWGNRKDAKITDILTYRVST